MAEVSWLCQKLIAPITLDPVEARKCLLGRRSMTLDDLCSPMLMEFSPIFYPQILVRSHNNYHGS